MYFRIIISRFIIGLFYLSILISCDKSNSAGGDSQAPVVTTSAATTLGQGWATINGTVNANDQETITGFEYDTVTTYTYTSIGDPDTVTGTTTTGFSSVITGLKPGKTYNFRAKAVNSSGTSYGDNLTFTTTTGTLARIVFNSGLSYGTVSDTEANIYKTIVIGTQTWMAENLRSTKFNDGTGITFITNNSKWSSAEYPAYSWYNNDSVNYGGLYNYYTISSERSLCPEGWHVPTDNEWTILIDYLGGETTAGKKLKETGTTHWYSSNLSATNESGFTALPAGYRSSGGTFNSIKRYAYWWSSTEMSSSLIYCRDINYSYDNVERGNTPKTSGMPVRCVKD